MTALVGTCLTSASTILAGDLWQIGKNAFWLLDWTPTQSGILRPDHISRYAELGDWLEECYKALAPQTRRQFLGGAWSLKGRPPQAALRQTSEFSASFVTERRTFTLSLRDGAPERCVAGSSCDASPGQQERKRSGNGGAQIHQLPAPLAGPKRVVEGIKVDRSRDALLTLSRC